MGKRNTTQPGVEALGKFLSRQLARAGLQQKDLKDRLAALGFEISNDSIHRLLKGKSAYLRLDLIVAIEELKFFVDDDGSPLTAQDLNAIACELRRAPGWVPPDPKKTAYPEAVKFLLEKKGDKTLDDFADYLRLPADEVAAVLMGRLPTVRQFLAMGVLMPNGDLLPLGRMYGLVDDAPLNGNL